MALETLPWDRSILGWPATVWILFTRPFVLRGLAPAPLTGSLAFAFTHGVITIVVAAGMTLSSSPAPDAIGRALAGAPYLAMIAVANGLLLGTGVALLKAVIIGLSSRLLGGHGNGADLVRAVAFAQTYPTVLFAGCAALVLATGGRFETVLFASVAGWVIEVAMLGSFLSARHRVRGWRAGLAAASPHIGAALVWLAILAGTGAPRRW